MFSLKAIVLIVSKYGPDYVLDIWYPYLDCCSLVFESKSSTLLFCNGTKQRFRRIVRVSFQTNVFTDVKATKQ